MSRTLTEEEITRQLEDLPEWSRTDETITATYELDDFVGALGFVNQVGEIAEDMQHHPDIDIRWNKVTLAFVDHEAGGVSQKCIEGAHRIAEILAS